MAFGLAGPTLTNALHCAHHPSPSSVKIVIERRYDGYLQASLERVCYPPVWLRFYCLIGPCLFESIGPSKSTCTPPQVVKELLYWQEPARVCWKLSILSFHDKNVSIFTVEILSLFAEINCLLQFPSQQTISRVPALPGQLGHVLRVLCRDCYPLHCRWLHSHIFHKLVLPKIKHKIGWSRYLNAPLPYLLRYQRERRFSMNLPLAQEGYFCKVCIVHPQLQWDMHYLVVSQSVPTCPWLKQRFVPLFLNFDLKFWCKFAHLQSQPSMSWQVGGWQPHSIPLCLCLSSGTGGYCCMGWQQKVAMMKSRCAFYPSFGESWDVFLPF